MQAHPYFWTLGVLLLSSQLPDLTHTHKWRNNSKRAFLKSMGSKTHVYPCWWRVVPPDGQHTARWTNFSLVFSQVAILVYYKMAIGCFSKSPTAIIITIIPNVISVSNTKLKVFWVQTQFLKSSTQWNAWSLITTLVFNFLWHCSTLTTFAPFRNRLWWIFHCRSWSWNNCTWSKGCGLICR